MIVLSLFASILGVFVFTSRARGKKHSRVESATVFAQAYVPTNRETATAFTTRHDRVSAQCLPQLLNVNSYFVIAKYWRSDRVHHYQRGIALCPHTCRFPPAPAPPNAYLSSFQPLNSASILFILITRKIQFHSNPGKFIKTRHTIFRNVSSLG